MLTNTVQEYSTYFDKGLNHAIWDMKLSAKIEPNRTVISKAKCEDIISRKIDWGACSWKQVQIIDNEEIRRQLSDQYIISQGINELKDMKSGEMWYKKIRKSKVTIPQSFEIEGKIMSEEEVIEYMLGDETTPMRHHEKEYKICTEEEAWNRI